jgi:hypothetical protein
MINDPKLKTIASLHAGMFNVVKGAFSALIP